MLLNKFSLNISWDILLPYFIVYYLTILIMLFIGLVSKNIANNVIIRIIRPNTIYIIIV